MCSHCVMEIRWGQFQIKVALIMYKSMFLSSVLFNCQAWSNLTETDINLLQTAQLRFLKRMLKTPRSTPNACLFLDLGLLPIKYEIHKRQLTFLHHILSLEENDPVQSMFYQQKLLPFEKNWANGITRLLSEYALGNNNEITKQDIVMRTNMNGNR